MFDVSGKVALITGASRGIGLALARGFAEAGAIVAGNASSNERLQQAVAELSGAGLKMHPIPFDVTDTKAVQAGVAQVEAELGPIDILVNNAGITRRSLVTEMTQQDWDAVLKVNLTAAMFVAQQVGRGMTQRGHGKVINICSLASSVARRTTAAYSATKAGLKLLTQVMAVEWAPFNVQVNGIAPGFFETDMTSRLAKDPELSAWVTDRTPAGRWGDTSELVGPVLFLASSASSYVTGHLLAVDGGYVAAM